MARHIRSTICMIVLALAATITELVLAAQNDRDSRSFNSFSMGHITC
jgi:hypothetical protein